MADQTVTLRLTANAAGLISAVSQGKGDVAEFGNAAEQAGVRSEAGFSRARRALVSISDQLSQARNALLGFIGITQAINLARQLNDMASGWANLSARLRLSTEGAAAFAVAQSDVFRISQLTSTSLADTAALYGRLSSALKDAKASQSEVATITQAVNQGLVVSGASAAESSSAILQLSQAMAAGALRGEEFNAVNEAAPRLMQALANSLGVTRGELRKMAEQGEITADVIRRALVDEAGKIAEEAAQMPLTIERAWTQLQNSVTRYVGQADQAAGASSAIAQAIANLANNLDGVERAISSVIEVLVVFAGARALGAAAAGLAALRTEMAAASLWAAWTGGARTAALAADAFGARLLALAGGPIVVASGALALLAIEIKKTWDAVSEAEQRGAQSVAMAQGSIGQALASSRRSIAGVEQDVERLTALMFRDRGRPQALERYNESLTQLKGSFLAAGGSVAQWEELLSSSTKAAAGAGSGATALGAAYQRLNAIGEKFATVQTRQRDAALALAEELRKLDLEEQRTPEILADIQSRRVAIIAGYQQQVAAIGGLNQANRQNEAATRAATKAEEARAEALSRLVEQQNRAANDEYMDSLYRAEDAALAAAGMIDALREEADQAGLTQQEVRNLAEAREFDAAMRSAQMALTPQQLADMRSEFQATQQLRDAKIDAARAQTELAQEAQRAAAESARAWEDFSYGLADAVLDGSGGVKRYFKRLLDDLKRELLASGLLNLFRRVFNIGGSGGVGAGSMLGAMFGLGGASAASAGNPGGMTAAAAGGMNFGNLLGGITGGSGIVGNLLGSTFGAVGGALAGFGGALGGFGAGLTVAGNAGVLAAGQFGMAQLAAGNLAVGLGSLVPVIGAIAAAVQIVNQISGGRLLGTSYRAESSTSTLSLGADGGDASQTIREVRQRSLFRGRQWRTRNVAPDDEAVAAAEQLYDAVRQVMVRAAQSLRGEAPEMIAAALRTVQEYDKNGKLTATKYFVDAIGRSWEEATAEAAAQRISAEGMIATIDAILGTTVSAAAASTASAAGEVVAAGAEGASDAIARVGDMMVKSAAGAMGEASAIAERWRDDAATLADGASMLLAAATDIRAGVGLLGEGGTLTQIADLVEELASEGETLTAAYARIAGSTALLTQALEMSGVELGKTREEFVRFAAGIAEAAGGLEAAQGLWNTFFQVFYSEAERAQYALSQAQAAAGREFGDIGLNLSDFQGDGGLQRFRQLFEQTLPTLSAEATVQWLEAARALGIFVELSGQVGGAVEGVTGSLEELMSDVSEQLAQYAPPPSFAERLAAITAETDSLIARATALGASEEQLAQIRQLSAARYTEVLDEMAAAQTRYTDIVAGLRDELADAGGLTEFQQQMREIDRWLAETTASMNEAARAAGMQGAAEGDLALAHEVAANRAAAAIARLQERGRDIVTQLYGSPLEQLNAQIQQIESSMQSFGGAVSGGMEQVTAAVGEAVSAQIGAQQRIRDWLDNLLGSELGGLRPRDQLAETQALFDRTLASALGGDAEAMSALPGLADQLLRLGQRVYASGNGYFDLRDTIRSALEQVAGLQLADGGASAGGGGSGIVNQGGGNGLNLGAGSGGYGSGGSNGNLAELYAERERLLAQQAAEERRALAQELAAVIRDLVVSTGRPLEEIEATLGVSMQTLVGDLGVSLSEMTVATATQLADIAQSMGVNLTDLAGRVGISLGDLADRQSLLNDALEAEITGLPQRERDLLQPLLARVEEAAALGDTAGVEEGIGDMEEAISGLSPEIRDALAPFFQAIRPVDPTTALEYASSTASTLQSGLGEWQAQTGLLTTIAGALGTIAGNLQAGGNLGGGGIGPVGPVAPPGYAVGTGYVPSDGLAYLHEGEAVLPAAVADFFRREGIPVVTPPSPAFSRATAPGGADPAVLQLLREMRDAARETTDRVRALGDRLQAVETTIARSAADVRRAAERQTDTIRR